MGRTKGESAAARRAGRRGLAQGVGLLWFLALALPAAASEVVAIRVGRHPTFTRVVFELDSRAGYQVEKPSGDKSTVVVKLEARSRSQSVSSKAELVHKVELEPEAGRSVARIQLARPGLPFKEMILAAPPRIVLDFLQPEEAEKLARSAGAEPARKPVVAARKPAPAQKAEKAEKKPVAAVEKKAPTVLAEAEGKKPVERPVEKPEPREAKAAPAPALPAAKPTPGREATPPPGPRPEPPAPTLRELEHEETVTLNEKSLPGGGESAKPETAPEAPAGAPAPAEAVAGKAAPAPAAGPEVAGKGDEEKVEGPLEAAAPEAPEAGEAALPAKKPELAQAPKPAPSAAPAPAPPAAKPVPAAKSRSGGPGLPLLAGIAAALAAVGAGAYVFLRRRALPNDADLPDFDESAPSLEDDLPSARSEERGAAEEMPPRSAAESFPFGGGGFEPGSGTVQETPLAAPAASLFDEDDEKGEAPMDQMDTQVGVGTRGAMPRMAPVGGDSDLARVVAELERRLTQTEQRIQEQNETVERLERQVAAQAEELRVQRAAIARTQRALRSMSRSEEEQATEPALREPGR